MNIVLPLLINMWILKVSNVEDQIGFTQKYNTYNAAEIDFLRNLKTCRDLGYKIVFFNDNSFYAGYFDTNKIHVKIKLKEL